MDINDEKQKCQEALVHLEDELKKLRTGRASASMLDGVMVEAYGQSTPLNQVATVSAPEATLLQLTPFDPNNLQAISQAIRDNQGLGLNPTDDGRVIRVPIPPLNEERRREIAKQLSGKSEETMIRLRNIRQEARSEAEKAKKDREISEDDFSRFEKQLDELMAEYKTKIEALAKAKETEIMTV
jgi:ribosome recycling factor